MSNVIKFPGHRLHRCRTNDETEECFACRGGLASCVTCGGAEASMPTHCPGERMGPFTLDSVQDKSMDFKNGKWVFYCWDTTHAV